MSESVFSFFKHNVGEEDIIKLLLMSAGKALVTVAILICALLSIFKLSEWYGFGFVALLTVTFTVLMLWSCMYIFGWAITGVDSTFDIFHYKTWSHVFDNLLPLNKMLYFDDGEIKPGCGESFSNYCVAWGIAAISTVILFGIGLVTVYIYAIIIALLEATTLSLEFLYIAVPCTLSVIIMSALFLKLKWRKIWLDGFNWNLAAWCICAAVVVTTIAFVTGVAIRRIAGFIGIEYTAILVALYVIITATYVYLDLKQWMINKARLAAIEEEKRRVESTPTSP